jgi:hypothetical protein
MTVGDADAAFVDAGDGSTSPEGGFFTHATCAEADQCEAGAPTCCGTLDFRPNCSLRKLTASCAPEQACLTTLQPFCGGTETVRLCATTAECTEPGFNRCCTFDIHDPNGQTLVMCASQAMANASDASCVP